MARVLHAPLAGEDLVELWVHVARNNPAAADRLLDRIEAACAMLGENPRAGRSREELAPGLRSFPVGAYVIFYRLGTGTVEIARVLHGARDLDLLF